MGLGLELGLGLRLRLGLGLLTLTLTLTRYGAWSSVKDAMQTSLMWSLIYEPKEGLIAPVTRNWHFAGDDADGDEVSLSLREEPSPSP